MCNLDHPIQTIDLTCPDSVAIVAKRGNGHPDEVFYSLPQLVEQKMPQVLADMQEAYEQNDEPRGFYLLGVLDLFAALVESNDILLGVGEASQAFGINDISDMWPEQS